MDGAVQEAPLQTFETSNRREKEGRKEGKVNDLFGKGKLSVNLNLYKMQRMLGRIGQKMISYWSRFAIADRMNFYYVL